jgi:glycosyltransferase involved in cell wall biosynthesis
MRVLHINSTSHTGGAARAMRRLHTALTNQGHESQFLVGRSRFPEDPAVHIIWDVVSQYRSLGNSLKSRIGNQFEKYLGLHSWANRTNLRITDTALYDWAEVIDLRNLFGGFFNLWCFPELSAFKPVVWRMPDLWGVTGHCAYPYDCQRWKTGCYRCPLLTKNGRKIVEPPPTYWDGTRRVWRAKRDLYQQSNLHIIVTTNWMKDQVSQSILNQAKSINVISNGVNLNIYQPIDQQRARSELDLPLDEPLLLWAAGGKGNYRKGYHLTVAALEEIQRNAQKTPFLVTMGANQGWDQPESLKKVKHLGFIRDPQQQALVYSAVDGFICSTLADGQPQTALEALACGTPLIAFDLGPMPELAIPGETGVLAGQSTPDSLQRAIITFLEREEDYPRMREACRTKALQEFDLEKQTQKYIILYQNLL